MGTRGDRTRPYTLKAGEGWTYHAGIDMTVKSSETQQGSGAAFLEYVTRKGEEPADHTHSTEDEIFYVVEGTVSFHCDGKTFDVERGGFVFLPRGLKHGYTIHGDDPVHLVVITSPVREGFSGGWGGFVGGLETGDGELVAKPPHVD